MNNNPTRKADPKKRYSIEFRKLDIQVQDAQGRVKTPWLGLVIENDTRLIAHYGTGYGEPTDSDEERLLAECRSETRCRGWRVSTDNSRAFKPRKIRGAIARLPFSSSKKKRRGR